MKKTTAAEIKPQLSPVKTTLRLDGALWREAKIAAINTGVDLQDLVTLALRTYLRTTKEVKS